MNDIPFDDRPNLLADISELDIGLMRNHLKDINSDLYEQSLKMNGFDIARKCGKKEDIATSCY